MSCYLTELGWAYLFLPGYIDEIEGFIISGTSYLGLTFLKEGAFPPFFLKCSSFCSISLTIASF